MEENQVACARCGWCWVVQKHKRGRKDLLCASCRAKPRVIIKYGDSRCQPWQGDFGGDGVTPFFGGAEFLPGVRVCGHKDCCNPNHVQQ